MSYATYIDRDQISARQARRRARGHQHCLSLRCDTIFLLVVQRRFRRYDPCDLRDHKAVRVCKMRIVRILIGCCDCAIFERDLRAALHRYPTPIIDEALKQLGREGRIIRGGRLWVSGTPVPTSIHLVKHIDPSMIKE